MSSASAKAKERAADEAALRLSDWKSLMALPVFRRWLWHHAGTVASLDLRSPLMLEAQRSCPLEFVELVREGLQAENAAAAGLASEAVPGRMETSSS